jgi:hypothetical protein
VLADEPPFQRLENPDTRRNAVRFACHIHEAIVKGQLTPPHGALEDNANRDQRSCKDGQEGLTSPRMQRPPAIEDRGTIVNPKRYRIARLEDDLWVYGMVQFESPKGAGDFAWLSKLDANEQARWLERLAAALLQDADSLRQSTIC